LRSERGGDASGDGVEVWLRGVNLHRGGRQVLHDLDWRLRPGERWVLAGANGSGKTQLLKLVSGAVWPDPPGSRRRRCTAPRRYRLASASGHHPGPWLDQPLGVAERIAYLGPERQERYERYGWNFPVRAIVATGCTRTDIPERPPTRAERRRVSALLREFGIERLASRPFLTLSYGQRRLVLLARAVASAPRLLLLDELFGGLDPVHRARLQRWFEGPGAHLSWVLATHRLDEAPGSATHCVRLERGQLRRTRLAVASRSAERRARAAVPAKPKAAAIRAAAAAVAPLPPRSLRNALVAFEHVSVFVDWHPVLRDIDLAIAAGQCWVVHGANGAGKTTLLRAIWGDWPAARGGRIRRRGIEPGVPLEDFQRRCGFVAPHQHGLQPPAITTLDVVVSGLRGTVGLASVATAVERRRARRSLAALDLAERAGDAFAALSWGTARRVLLARATVHRPRLLLLDEPCSGLDPAMRRRLRDDVDALLARGLTVVMSAHHRDEWPRRTTHELELRDGRATYAGPRRY
jgi:molybdate transport system ATP-binding protein